MMRDERFDLCSQWQLEAAPEAVWKVLTQAEDWPAWWSFVESVDKLEAGGADGIGSLWRHEWRTLLPYRLRFYLRMTHIEPPRRLEADVSGDLAGSGLCVLEPTHNGTLLSFQWRVRPCKPWMRILAPLARPVFLWNHRMVMGRGERQLARRLQLA